MAGTLACHLAASVAPVLVYIPPVSSSAIWPEFQKHKEPIPWLGFSEHNHNLHPHPYPPHAVPVGKDPGPWC